MFCNDQLYFDFDLSWANSVLAKYLSRSLDIARKIRKGGKTYEEVESKFFVYLIYIYIYIYLYIYIYINI